MRWVGSRHDLEGHPPALEGLFLLPLDSGWRSQDLHVGYQTLSLSSGSRGVSLTVVTHGWLQESETRTAGLFLPCLQQEKASKSALPLCMSPSFIPLPTVPQNPNIRGRFKLQVKSIQRPLHHHLHHCSTLLSSYSTPDIPPCEAGPIVD